MDEKSGKKSGFLLEWPKKFRRTTAESTDDDQRLLTDIFRRANEEAEAQDQQRQRRRRNRFVLTVASFIVVTIIMAGYIAEQDRKLKAPEHVIKTHDAQQRIIYGSQYESLKSRHPDEPVILPMDTWKLKPKKEQAP